MRQAIACGFALTLCLCATSSGRCDYQIHVAPQEHVSPQGTASSDGSLSSPFATIEQARDHLRQLRTANGPSKEPVVVWIHGGVYSLRDTLTFTSEDSGTKESPIHYRNYQDEQPVLSGQARKTPVDRISQLYKLGRIPMHARDHVCFFQLNEQDIQNVSALYPRSHHAPMHPAPIEVFQGASALPRAGWPDGNWQQVEGLSHGNHWRVPRAFQVDGASKIWAHGFWSSDWEDAFAPLNLRWDAAKPGTVYASIDPSTPVREGARYRIENLPSELDTPGEWWLDENDGVLAVWPIDDDPQDLTISWLETAVSCYDTEYLSFEGLTIEGVRVMGVEIVGGREVAIESCTIRHVGNVAVNLYHGHDHQVAHCRIHGVGSSGVRVEGGERTELTSAGHRCEENEIHNCGYSYSSRRPAIDVHGVGIRVAGNHIHDLPDSAVVLHGNDHVVEANHIHHVCTWTSDSGAISISHDPTYRGNRISFNHVHDLGGFCKQDIVGIYLDDFASGTIVEGNVLRHTIRGIVVGGGRDNRIEENVIIDCLAGIQLDNRGTTWAKEYFAGESSTFQRLCQQVRPDHGAYAEHYPELGKSLTDEPQMAKGNIVRANVIRCPIRIDLQEGLDESLVTIEANANGQEAQYAEIDWDDPSSIATFVAERVPLYSRSSWTRRVSRSTNP